MNFHQVLHASPPQPECFTLEAWVRYLHSEQNGSKAKPFSADGNYRQGFNFCRTCTLEHSVQMCIEGKCNPSVHRATKETRHVETV